MQYLVRHFITNDLKHDNVTTGCHNLREVQVSPMAPKVGGGLSALTS